MSNPPRKTLKLPAKGEGELAIARGGRRPVRAANAPRSRQPQPVATVPAGKPAEAAGKAPHARPQRSSPEATNPRRGGTASGNAETRTGRPGSKPPTRGRDDERGGRPGFAGKPGPSRGRPGEAERGADERRRDFRANDPAAKGRVRDGDKLETRGGRPATPGDKPFARGKAAADARFERGQDGERRPPRSAERTNERAGSAARGNFAGRDASRADTKAAPSGKPAGHGKPAREAREARDSSPAPWREAPRPAASARPASIAAGSERPPRPSRTPERDAAAPEGVRVSKLLSEQGLCSRREADDYIERGWVFVDGKRVTELGVRVPATAVVTLAPEAQAQQTKRVTILLHKPIGYVSGQPEPGCIPAVKLILPENQYQPPGAPPFRPGHLQGLAPAGRLDLDSTGLLVLTQDGRVARALIGDNSTVDKEYLVRVEGRITEEGLALLRHGLELDGRQLRPAIVERLNEDQLRFVLREGRKRQIRRMCELVGLTVVGLKRVRIGRVALGALPLGQWRYLNDDESF